MGEEFRFQLWQSGTVVAAVSAPDRARALIEIGHYARQYEQDGPVEIKEVKKRAARGSFDRLAYQREYMRKRRASGKVDKWDRRRQGEKREDGK